MAILVLAGLLALGATRSVAGPPTDQLKGAIGAVQRVLGDQTLQPQAKAKARWAALRRAVRELFDREESARRALAYHWRDRTDAERAEFATLFGDLLERAYLSTLERYEGETIYTGEVIHGDRATVRTRILTAEATDIAADYRMLRRGQRWHVYDVSLEGMGMVPTYRTQFNRIILTSSYGELVKKLRAEREPAGTTEKATAHWIAPLLTVLSLFSSQRQPKMPAGLAIAPPRAPEESAPATAQPGTRPPAMRTGGAGAMTAPTPAPAMSAPPREQSRSAPARGAAAGNTQ
jgi:phospholipid transport system substrate-binding protein